jgi:hypothetical protein
MNWVEDRAPGGLKAHGESVQTDPGCGATLRREPVATTYIKVDREELAAIIERLDAVIENLDHSVKKLRCDVMELVRERDDAVRERNELRVMSRHGTHLAS